MTFDQFMHYSFWVWLFVAISFVFFLLGRLIGYKEGWSDAKALYKVDYER